MSGVWSSVCVCTAMSTPCPLSCRGCVHRLGDTPLMAEHGSLHQYLRHRHAKDGPIVAFWWTDQQRMVSIASPELFKAINHLFDRPGTVQAHHLARLLGYKGWLACSWNSQLKQAIRVGHSTAVPQLTSNSVLYTEVFTWPRWASTALGWTVSCVRQ